MLTDTQRALAVALLDIGAVRFGAFKLKLHEKSPTAPLSPIYIDLRVIRSFPRAMDVAAEALRELTSDTVFDCYADVPTAATPIVAVLSYKTGRPMISPRLDKKTHGTGATIDGAFKAGQVALLIDDLITKAESKLEAISSLEANGLLVRDVLVLVDRQQGGVRELAERGYRCRAALGLTDMLDFYHQSQTISEDDYLRTTEYLGGSV
jgi:uridine monophosphate synthetase